MQRNPIAALAAGAASILGGMLRDPSMPRTPATAARRSAAPDGIPPSRLPASEPSPQAYPVELLTPGIRVMTRAVMALVQAPAAICAHAVLGTVSLAVSKLGRVETLSPGGASFTAGFFLAIAESGERKTAADRLAGRGVNAVFARQLADYKAARAACQAARETPVPGEAAPEAPVLRPFVVTDPTYEGMIKVIEAGAGFVGLLTDEAGMFFGGHSMSQDQRAKVSAGLSRFWDGSPTVRPRAGREGLGIVPATPTTLNLMLQPNFLPHVFADDLLVSQGFLSRVLPVWPASTMGNRLHREPAAEDRRVVAEFAARIEELLETALWSEADRPALRLAPAARMRCTMFHDEIERQLGQGQKFRDISGFAAKAAEHACRLAGMMSLFEDPEAAEVTEDVMAGACGMMHFYLEEFRHIRAASTADEDCGRARRLLEWLLGEAGAGGAVSRERIQQYGPIATRRAAELNRAVKILCACGALCPLDEGTIVDGKPRRHAYRLHAQAHLSLGK